MEGRLQVLPRPLESGFRSRLLQSAAQCSMTSTPTKSVRLSVPVSPEVHATFQRLAEASGRSMAASLSQWLVDTQQAAELMAQNIERLRASPGDVVARVKLHIASLEDMAEQAIEDAMQRADQVQYSVPPATKSAARGRRDAGQIPPSSNTGGKGPKQGGRIAGRK